MGGVLISSEVFLVIYFTYETVYILLGYLVREPSDHEYRYCYRVLLLFFHTGSKVARTVLPQ
jgi:hypothetical protein